MRHYPLVFANLPRHPWTCTSLVGGVLLTNSWNNDPDVTGHNSGKLSLLSSGLDLHSSIRISAVRRPRVLLLS